MAGLIQQNMGAEAQEQGNAALEMEQQGAMSGMPMGAEGEVEVDENEPNYRAGVEYLNEVLYSKGAAKDISAQLKEAPALVTGMAEIAYDITSIVDERTDGNIPDELLVPMAMQVLEEVVDIAEATGLNPTPEDVALAFRQMILRYLQEQGLDTTQLDQAMNQVDPSVFNKVLEDNKQEA